ncbi:DUF5919 domain-containing protein [Micromonospora sp. RTGN7]|uniref:DUF5919 domain-containing protein n=1 Tax=Micromonospora sp. RTGN7 TaxID=3016526 RepID=UPI0029FEE410|nr:DUF5919 domain-containing protein [Micromonospora sp. RTGN7]
MTTVQRWTGRETRALRHALRMSIKDFAAHLGVAERTVSKWEAGQETVCPRPEMQAALDTALGKANEEVRSRFASTANVGDSLRPPADAGRPDFVALAQQQTIRVRTAAGLNHENFARLLASLLTWSPTAADVRSWETVAVPPGDVMLALRSQEDRPEDSANQLAGLTAVYPNRSELSARLPASRLFDNARDIRATGLSLNVLCQDYADHGWHALVEKGAHIRCLFLDPDGAAIPAREAEEGFPSGQLSALTKLNIETMLRVRDRLPAELRSSLELATYDSTLRFNIVLVDGLCVTQPYLTESRGVDAPAFVMRRQERGAGLYPVFEQVFKSQWKRGRLL